MRAPRSHRTRSVLLVAALALAACGGGGERIADVEIIDMQTPAMFREIARGLKRPYLLEMPERPVNERFDLKMKNVRLEDVLEELGERDPTFEAEERGELLLMYPVGADGEKSPFTSKIEQFSAEGGVSIVALQLLQEADLASTTSLSIAAQGKNRPVVIDMKSTTVRDVLGEIARQGHLIVALQPGTVHIEAQAQD